MRHEADTVLDLGELGQVAVRVDFVYTPSRPRRFCASQEQWLPPEDEALEILRIAARPGPPLTALRHLAGDLDVSLEDLLRDRLVEAVTR